MAQDVVFVSLVSAFLAASATVTARKGLLSSDPITATVIPVTTQTVFFWILFVFTDSPGNLLRDSVVIFFIAGIFGPGLTRIFYNMGLARTGPPAAETVINSSTLFVILPAVFFLGERLDLRIASGIGLILTGIVLAEKSISGSNVSTLQERSAMKKGVIYVLAAAATLSISYFFRKLGINMVASPILGATITSTAALLFVFSIAMAARRGGRRFIYKRPSGWIFLVTGLLMSGSWLAQFHALAIGDVILVTAVQHTSPLFSIILTAVVLGRSEKITIQMIGGAVSVVLGTWLLSSR